MKKLNLASSTLSLIKSLIIVGLIAYSVKEGAANGVSDETFYTLFMISLMFLLYNSN